MLDLEEVSDRGSDLLGGRHGDKSKVTFRLEEMSIDVWIFESYEDDFWNEEEEFEGLVAWAAEGKVIGLVPQKNTASTRG